MSTPPVSVLRLSQGGTLHVHDMGDTVDHVACPLGDLPESPRNSPSSAGRNAGDRAQWGTSSVDTSPAGSPAAGGRRSPRARDWGRSAGDSPNPSPSSSPSNPRNRSPRAAGNSAPPVDEPTGPPPPMREDAAVYMCRRRCSKTEAGIICVGSTSMLLLIATVAAMYLGGAFKAQQIGTSGKPSNSFGVPVTPTQDEGDGGVLIRGSLVVTRTPSTFRCAHPACLPACLPVCSRQGRQRLYC